MDWFCWDWTTPTLISGISCCDSANRGLLAQTSAWREKLLLLGFCLVCRVGSSERRVRKITLKQRLRGGARSDWFCELVWSQESIHSRRFETRLTCWPLSTFESRRASTGAYQAASRRDQQQHLREEEEKKKKEKEKEEKVVTPRRDLEKSSGWRLGVFTLRR